VKCSHRPSRSRVDSSTRLAEARGSRDRFRTLMMQLPTCVGLLADSVSLVPSSAVSPSYGRSRNRSCRLRRDVLRFQTRPTIAPSSPFSPPRAGQIRSRDRHKFVGELRGTIAGRAGVVELAYTPALGAGARESMRVRVPPPAQLVSDSSRLVLAHCCCTHRSFSANNANLRA
jgi:hypothetical protein